MCRGKKKTHLELVKREHESFAVLECSGCMEVLSPVSTFFKLTGWKMGRMTTLGLALPASHQNVGLESNLPLLDRLRDVSSLSFFLSPFLVSKVPFDAEDAMSMPGGRNEIVQLCLLNCFPKVC